MGQIRSVRSATGREFPRKYRRTRSTRYAARDSRRSFWGFRRSELVMGETAENLASMYKISRDQQDEYSLRSQQRAAAATRSKRFAEELIPVSIPGKKGETPARPNGQPNRLEFDEHVRMDASLADMKKLSPVFNDNGTVTAGNSSGITDGASATVLVSEEEAKARNLEPLARIVDYAIAGVDPKIMGIGPVPAVRKLLSKTGLRLG